MVAKGVSPEALNPDVLRVEFDRGHAKILSLKPFALQSGPAGVTDILFVQPPYSDFGSPVEVAGITDTLAHSDEFHFEAAVLGPDGRLSSFSSDIGVLRNALRTAATVKTYMTDINGWRMREEQAFLTLRALKGRHVIVRLFNTLNPHHIPGKDTFLRDKSLETYASFDLAPVYRLIAPPDVSLTIPRGDASTQESMGGRLPDSLGIEQSQQMQAAIAQQADLWANQNWMNSTSPGEDEVSTRRIISDVIADNRSTYDLIVQPQFPCSDTHFREVSIRTSEHGKRLFFPHALQMIPWSP